MAEFLIYNKEHWMSKLTSAEIAEYTKTDKYFPEKVAGQYVKGDIIEVRQDGFYTDPKARGFNKNAFRVISVPGLKANNTYKKTTGFYKSRFKITDDDKLASRVTVKNSVNKLTIIDKGE